MSHPGVFAQRRCGVGSTCFFEHVTANCEVEFPTLKNLTTHDMRVIEEIVSTVSGDVSVAERASAVRAVLGHYSQGELDFIIENNTHSYDRAQALRTSRLDPRARPFSSAENILERHTRESEATIAAARPAHRCAPRGAREQHTHSYDRAQALRTSRLDPRARPFSSAENILERHTRESEATIAAARPAHRCAPRGAREQHTHSYDRAQALRTSRLDPRARPFSSAENILERHTRESEATIAAARPAHRCCADGLCICAFVRFV